MKDIKAASKAYEALADAYEELDNMSKLKAQVQAGSEVWAEVWSSYTANCATFVS